MQSSLLIDSNEKINLIIGLNSPNIAAIVLRIMSMKAEFPEERIPPFPSSDWLLSSLFNIISSFF